MAVKRNTEREKEFDVATAAPLAANGDRRFTPRQQHAWRSERLSPPRYLERNPAHHLADIARLAGCGGDFAQAHDAFAVCLEYFARRVGLAHANDGDHADAAIESAKHLGLADLARRG